MVRLCRAPRADPREFWEDVECVASRFGLDPDRLADAVQRGEAIRAMQQAQPGTRGMLLAARDGEELPPPPEPPAKGPPEEES